jgi:DNA polymerase-3 subunit beta|uniref:Beta sliding clamp n=1 Tax=candidate division WOR-3 bacterium TaxID=2052148 RepID=A0A7V3V0A1_UNCW3
MRCALEREILVEALGTVVNVLPGKATYPVYQNILLEVEKGKLAITGADLDNTVRREIELTEEWEAGRVLVDGRRLTGLVQASTAKLISVKTTENRVVIAADRMKADFTQLAPEEFPTLPSLPTEIQLEFPLATLFDMFDTCSFAVSRDESRPIMTAVNWEVGKTESRMVATDSIRLAFVRRKVKSQNKVKLLVTPKAIELLPRGEEKVEVFADQKLVGFKLKDTTVISRMIEGQYPNYEQVIPKNLPAQAVINREQLISAMRRALIFTNPIAHSVSIEFAAKHIIIRAKSEVGETEEELDCQFKGDNLTAGFNGMYLLDIINHIKTEELIFELSSPMTPVVIKPAVKQDDGEDLFIIMPVRLE